MIISLDFILLLLCEWKNDNGNISLYFTRKHLSFTERATCTTFLYSQISIHIGVYICMCGNVFTCVCIYVCMFEWNIISKYFHWKYLWIWLVTLVAIFKNQMIWLNLKTKTFSVRIVKASGQWVFNLNQRALCQHQTLMDDRSPFVRVYVSRAETY